VIGAVGYAAVATLPGDASARAIINARAILTAEHRLGLAVEQGIQQSWLGRGVVGFVLAVAYALLYWPFVAGTVVVTAWRDRPAFRRLRNALLISGAIGLVVMALFPVVPPRLLDGYEDRLAGVTLLGSVAHPDGLFNPHAAMPSFHVGWMVLAAFGLRRLAGRAWRYAPPAVMALAVITTGNHYLLDVVAGGALATLAWWLAAPMQRALDEAAATRVRSREKRRVASRHRSVLD